MLSFIQILLSTLAYLQLLAVEPTPLPPDATPQADVASRTEPPIELDSIGSPLHAAADGAVTIAAESSCARNLSDCCRASGADPDSQFIHKVYLKTNMPAWAMLWINAAVEFDITERVSAQLPVYYSGFNYFTRTLKFRTFALQPSLRWWPRRDNMGFFLEGHFGLAWYDFAKDGEFRYQDHFKRRPAIGGGIGIGYRFHFNSNRRWTMEASLGAGIYHLNYDIFENHTNGYIVGQRRRTFYGIDHAALSISYSFDLGKKGGVR